MKILDVHCYRDGGTKLIETDEGRFWIPVSKEDIWMVTKGDPFPGDSTTQATKEEIIKLLDTMCHQASAFHWIKRHVTG